MWQTVGIPAVEAQVYEALIPQAMSTVDGLQRRTLLKPARITRALTDLIGRGLVTKTPGRPARYTAVAPSLAGSVLIAKREYELGKLQQYLNGLEEAFRAGLTVTGPADHVEVVEGATRIYQAFVRIQRAARHEVRAFDKPPYFVAPGEHGDDGPNLEERRSLEQGQVGYRVVYDQDSVALPGRLENIWDGIRRGERARVGPGVPVKLVISDNTEAIISSPADFEHGVAYVLRPSSLLDLASGLFEATWDRALPLNRTDKNDATIDETDRQLFGLLATGATDEVIARTFGWSIRTVQRHLHEIMRRVGAQTRFQAGMEAVRRGWV
jgi:DNA-binding CsgD family transcriptional regulator/DNA-binding MarR family transcriptional regulator